MKRRKPPPKAVLLQLQKLYKTDERIGERLGGVPAYLVAYWRRKKGIPRYSLPKFSEQEIRTLWERYGDDEKAGLELGISKAAFYNWRRRYGIRQKPAFLRLEQLEFDFPGIRQPQTAGALWGGRTAARKILARLLDRKTVDVGEEVRVEPDLVLPGPLVAEAVELLRKGRSETVASPGKTVLTLSMGASEAHGNDIVNRTLREFARRQGIKWLYDHREGAGFQVVMENGHLLPGQLAVVGEKNAVGLGCLSALSLQAGPESVASVWRGEGLPLTVPGSVEVTVLGRRPHGVMTVDIALNLIRRLLDQPVAGRVVEFTGSAVSHLSVTERFLLACMCAALNPAGAVCAYDSAVRRFLAGRTITRYTPALPDKDAEYEERYQFSIEQLTPQIAGPDGVRTVRRVAELAQTPVQVVIIGSCHGGRFEELRAAADILKGQRVHPDCRLFVIPGTRAVYLEALKKGLIRVFLEAAAVVTPPGFCPCRLVELGAVEKGERVLTTGLSHDGNRLAESGAEVYICSPATAAASAVQGVITNPAERD